MIDWSSRPLLLEFYSHAPADQTASRFTEKNTKATEESGGEKRSTGQRSGERRTDGGGLRGGGRGRCGGEGRAQGFREARVWKGEWDARKGIVARLYLGTHRRDPGGGARWNRGPVALRFKG